MDTTEELRAEIARLKHLIDRDRTGLADALNAVRRVARGYYWIALGEWGSYKWHERTGKTLREEVKRCLDEIDTIVTDALRESGRRADAAFRKEKSQ